MKRYDVKKSAARMELLRTSRGYSLTQAAGLLGIDEVTLRSAETGEQPGTVELFAGMAQLYEVPLDFLILADDHSPQQREIDRLLDELKHT